MMREICPYMLRTNVSQVDNIMTCIMHVDDMIHLAVLDYPTTAGG